MRAIFRAVAGAAVLVGYPVGAATIIVPDDNPSIHDAVESASAGDVVQIRAGSYIDRIRVDRGQTGLTIESLGGRAYISVDQSDDAVRIRDVDGVTVRGLTLLVGRHGVRIDDATNVTLEELSIGSTREDGIRMDHVTGASVTNCSVSQSRGRGIRVDHSANVSISGRLEPLATVSNAVHAEGIRAQQSTNLSLSHTVVSASAGRDGIRIIKCANTMLDANSSVANSGSGIRVQASPNLTITNNVANGNREYGFRVQKSPPVASVADLTGAGNVASGNGIADLRAD